MAQIIFSTIWSNSISSFEVEMIYFMSETTNNNVIGLELSFSGAKTEDKERNRNEDAFLFLQCKSEEDYYELLYQPEASHQLLLNAEKKRW